VDEILNHYREIDYLLPETLKVMDKTLTLVKQMHAKGERFDSVRYEQMQYTKDGRVFWTDTLLTGVYDERGQLKELLGVSRDNLPGRCSCGRKSSAFPKTTSCLRCITVPGLRISWNLNTNGQPL
jgi:hypothetical protein